MTAARPRPDPRQLLGQRGEDRAEETLRAAGLEILERRYRRRRGEIDLIALDGDRVVFVEVKARSGTGLGYPAEAVTATKRRRMARVALLFLQQQGWLERSCRFDVVEVLEDQPTGELVVRHIEDAFRLGPDGS